MISIPEVFIVIKSVANNKFIRDLKPNIVRYITVTQGGSLSQQASNLFENRKLYFLRFKKFNLCTQIKRIDPNFSVLRENKTKISMLLNFISLNKIILKLIQTQRALNDLKSINQSKF